MLRRSVLSMLTGAVLAALFLFVPATAANCYHNLCADIEGYTYAGCSVHFDANGNVDVFVCAYTKDSPGEVN